MRIGAICLLIGPIGLCTFFQDASTAPINSTQVEAYLRQFGHLDETPGSAPSEIQDAETKYRSALMRFQQFAGIPVTGEPDEKTLEIMALPRCAVPDNTGHTVRRRKRYVAQGSKWPNPNLRYYFVNTTKRMTSALNKQIVRKAFQFWTNASSLVITETLNSNLANIKLLYAVRAHGDAWPFDGKGGVLGHAFFPDSGGDAHFDDDEVWTDSSTSGTNLLQVTAHEVGHSLGLGHSSDESAVMAPFYTGYKPGFRLAQDDINGIRFLYGYDDSQPSSTPTSTPSSTAASTVKMTSSTAASTVTMTSSTSSSPATGNPLLTSFCSNGTVNAIVYTGSQTLAFQGQMYASLDVNGVLPGYPRLIRRDWPDLPNDLDSALYLDAVITTDSDGRNVLVDPAHLYFFKGDKYWRYNNTFQLDQGYPKLIRDGFPGIPDSPDASFVWSGNGKIYFVKGDEYYCYTRWRGADSTYPRTMAVWRGLPRQIDAVFQWSNSRTYFFGGIQYYRFNDIEFYVDAGYPKTVASSWFNCPEGSRSPSAESLVMEQQQADDQFHVVTPNAPRSTPVDFSTSSSSTSSSLVETNRMDENGANSNANSLRFSSVRLFDAFFSSLTVCHLLFLIYAA